MSPLLESILLISGNQEKVRNISLLHGKKKRQIGQAATNIRIGFPEAS
jgi:hypothetical protein